MTYRGCENIIALRMCFEHVGGWFVCCTLLEDSSRGSSHRHSDTSMCGHAWRSDHDTSPTAANTRGLVEGLCTVRRMWWIRTIAPPCTKGIPSGRDPVPDLRTLDWCKRIIISPLPCPKPVVMLELLFLLGMDESENYCGRCARVVIIGSLSQ